MRINIPPGLIALVIKSPKKISKAFKLILKGDLDNFIKKFRDNRQIYVLKYQLGKKSWIDKIYPEKEELSEQIEKSQKLNFRPKISIITPTYNSKKKYLRDCIESVIKQTYDNWELCIADDHSTDQTTRAVIQEFTKKDNRIKYIFREKNGGISAASNSSLKISTGEFVGLLDHDDILLPNALFEVVSLLNENPEADFVYSDEDKFSKDGKKHSDRFFKPDWSPDLLYSFMYTGHFTVYRKSLVTEIGGFDSKYDFSQDYDLALRMSEKTKNIFHIKKILYSWRAHEESGAAGGKPYARESNLKALEAHFQRRGLKGKVKEYPFANKFEYDVDTQKKVSIIIPSDNLENSQRLISSIKHQTPYKNIEILLVINPTTGNRIKKTLSYDKLKIIPYDQPFNFSAKCNLGAKNATGEFLVFLNDDMEILETNWVESLVEFFQRKEVGAVSPKLLYEDDTIQHAGMITGVRGLVTTAFHKKPKDTYEYFNLAQSTRNASLLSAACLAIPKQIFNEIGGFDEVNTPINHSDIDLCFRIREAGYLLVYTPFTNLRHFGHKSIGKLTGKSRQQVDASPDLYILNKWGKYIAYDPYYPETIVNNLTENEVFEFKIYPGHEIRLETSKKKLLFVSHEATLSGAPLLLLWLAKELRKRGIFITFFLPTYGPLVNELHKEGFTVFVDEQYLDKVDYSTKKFLTNFDFVLANTINNWKIALSAEEVGVPVLWYIHESQYGIERIKDLKSKDNGDLRNAFKLSDKVLFPSKYTEELYKTVLPLKNTAALHSAIETPPVSNHTGKRKKIGRPFTILHVGSVERRKGQDLMIEVFQNLPTNLQNKMRLNLIGRVLDKKYYKQLQSKSSNNENIKFLGNLDHEEVLRNFQSSDLFVCSARDETGPITLIEAMGYEVPIVSTSVGIVPEILVNNKNALVVEKNVNSISDGVIKLFSDEKLKLKLTSNAKKTFEKDFTINVYAEKFLKILDKVELKNK